MEHILRDIKLTEITGDSLTCDAAKLVKFWDELWSDMKVYIDPSEGEIKCWKDGYNYYYFYQNDENDNLWCNYSKVWSFFSNELGLDYVNTVAIIQHMMGKTLNNKLATPRLIFNNSFIVVDATLKPCNK